MFFKVTASGWCLRFRLNDAWFVSKIGDNNIVKRITVLLDKLRWRAGGIVDLKYVKDKIKCECKSDHDVHVVARALRVRNHIGLREVLDKY